MGFKNVNTFRSSVCILTIHNISKSNMIMSPEFTLMRGSIDQPSRLTKLRVRKV